MARMRSHRCVVGHGGALGDASLGETPTCKTGPGRPGESNCFSVGRARPAERSCVSAALARCRAERAALSFAAIGPIAVHFPEQRETIDTLRDEFPEWDVDLIYRKTGINARYIAKPEETASDLGVAAAERL